MCDFLSKSLQKTRSIFKSKPPYPPAWPLQDEQHPKPQMNAQEQCPIFAKLSAELRVMVYEAVLIDSSRYLHICTNRRSKRERRGRRAVRSNAHFWCIEQDSPFPTWQHAGCYGEWLEPTPHYSTVHTRPITTTDDKILSLLITCRRVYSETLRILYSGNTFHFRGGPGLVAFTSSVSPSLWMSIRHVHISTQHLYSAPPWILNEWPPENPDTWATCCQKLQELPNLQSLTFDMTLKWREKLRACQLNYGLEAALLPLLGINAKSFIVEVDMSPSQEVRDALGHVNFVLVVKERPRTHPLYHHSPILDIGDYN
ncbi:hypothetical protein CC86DRAFT_361784 [Ophiobolus disseminans]|uniref:DUF7730 domain-containing protein n=1 Tax=Ophiobolus disseminans TaxID=1469910 RepID=A0A6A6ZGW7_9PLEO|nr:hypothetical protein CC86DRAFT_361784 [Ophiobolus disseminans]